MANENYPIDDWGEGQFDDRTTREGEGFPEDSTLISREI